MVRLLTQRELSQECNIPERTLERWRHKKKGPPYIKVEGLVRYPEPLVGEYFQKNTHWPTKPDGAVSRPTFSSLSEAHGRDDKGAIGQLTGTTPLLGIDTG